MQYLFKIIGLVFCSLLLISCDKQVVKGSGKVVTETRQLSAFKQLKVSGNFNLIVVTKKAQKLMITTDDNLQPYILTKIENDKLYIFARREYQLSPSIPITLYLEAPRLSGVALDGAVKASMTKIAGRHFAIQATGNTKLTLSGEVNKASLGVLGAAQIDAKDLQSHVVDLDVTGKAKVSVKVTKKLNVKISGDGQVIYYGQPPIVHQAIFGNGKIRRE